ncbi:MAG TPA: glutaminyl-peptide cyclotransferase [Terriglobia bacterium]|nr:glutaminyl-peptide cyclotransferase [Terriglobia bacterium]
MFLSLLCLFVAISLSAQTNYGYRVVKSYPHDRTAFTQGLEYHDGFLYEGTGLVGRSSLRKVNLETGQVLQSFDVPPPFFGEGITVLNQKIVQLTWQSQTGFVYDKSSFRIISSFNYPGEGWGMTNDGKQIYMSDGTSQIRVWDPAALKEVRRITVKDGSREVTALNELEFVRGEILANVWQTDRIARISPADGKVLGWVDLSGILPKADHPEAESVLNGIAYDAAGDRLFITGKLWPKIFEIKLLPKK